MAQPNLNLQINNDNYNYLNIAIVKALWNSQITDKLEDGAIKILSRYNVKYETFYVPGSVELVFAAKKLAQLKKFDAIIVLGCVIQGETKHFDYVCDFVTHGIKDVNVLYDTPIIFGVLTVNNIQQAFDRCGGKYGNKGEECAMDAIYMAKFNRGV